MTENHGLSLAGRVTPESAQKDLDEFCALSTKIRYGVRIVGHEAPFKWTVERWMPDHPQSTTLANREGESDTYEDAQFDAAEAAREAEWIRRHAATVHQEPLFEVDPN